MMETYYVAADKSNVTRLFSGIEPMYWIPPYAEELVVPVQCTGPAGATITCTMRRFWSAGLDWSSDGGHSGRVQELEDFGCGRRNCTMRRIQQQVEQPWIRLWDGNWHYRGVLASEISGNVSLPLNGTETHPDPADRSR